MTNFFQSILCILWIIQFTIYLCSQNDEKVELFSSLYDLVLLNDETFDIPLFILSSIVDSTELCKHESKNETPNI